MFADMQNYYAMQNIDSDIRRLEAELQRLRNLRFSYRGNQSYQGQLPDYQSQHYFNESQSEYFGKK